MERLVPLGVEALYWVQRYLQVARPELLDRTPAMHCSPPGVAVP